MLAVGSSVFVFSSVVERSGDDSLHNGRLAWRGYSPLIIVAFALSIVIGWVLALYSAVDIRIPLGVVSLMLGVLYVGAARGVWLMLLSLAMYFLFSHHIHVTELIVQTGLLLFPIAGVCSHHFNTTSVRGKRIIVMLLILLNSLISLLFSVIQSRIPYDNHPMMLVVILIILSGLLAGDYCVKAIERIIERKQISRQMMDLSNRVITEAEKLRQIMNEAPMMITAIDQNGYITSVNDAALQLLKRSIPGLSRENIQSVCLLELNVSQITVGLKRTIELINRVNEKRATEHEILQLDYGIYYINVAPLFYEAGGTLSGYVVIGQDVTEVERLRNELSHVEQLSLVGKMAASITHEIRNPMAVVRGFLQLMREKSPSSLDHYYLIVMDELDRANSIINDFLSLAQNRIVEKQLVDLHNIIEELLPLLWADANLRGQSIVFNPGHIVPRLDLNSKEIKQLILNLARNGMEAMGDKGELTISTEASASEVILNIRDTGPGIPADKLDKLFEPFYTTKSTGTGLGLSLCISIVERHNGRIVVDSVEGEGTLFSVIFKRIINENEQPTARTGSSVPQRFDEESL